MTGFGFFYFQIVKEAYPDHTQFEKSNPHYDPSSKEDNPKWSMVTPVLVSYGRVDKRRNSVGYC